MSKKQSYYMQTDLIILFILLVCTSLMAIYNAQSMDQYENGGFLWKQAVWFTVGALVVAAMQYFDLDQLYKASIFIYAFGVFLLALLLVSPAAIAEPVNGAKSWFQLPGFTIQPSEFAKISTIVFLSATVSHHKGKHEVNTLKTDSLLLIKLIVITVLPVILIMMQPDFGTAMVYLFIMGMFILLSGIDWKIIGTLILGVAVFLGAMLGLILRFPVLAKDLIGIEQYQINRILTWFNPSQPSSDASWHFDQAFMALGSGQLFGKGLGDLEVYYPEAQTDFIFAVIGESFGFIGSALVIFLYFMLLYKLVTLGLNIYKHSPFGTYLCFGYFSMLFIHAFQNIGMTLGIMPVTGIPLLLISYGGSSVLSTMIGFGLIYRVAVEGTIQNDYLFK
ncbi:FtsW/RodA/SpoVE family cell cycle protein [Lentibacillus sediminis]|uniref:FtsW/RodA/SpoVE family cell cycle protein n=1 Tax=Lentibacillus sediminis TaxID=1940529 RepID=UPI000C1BA465|nr:FtsW/RodA/SpoVE family cell cycle protein [Lentibacillus sediminis]